MGSEIQWSVFVRLITLVGIRETTILIHISSSWVTANQLKIGYLYISSSSPSPYGLTRPQWLLFILLLQYYQCVIRDKKLFWIWIWVKRLQVCCFIFSYTWCLSTAQQTPQWYDKEVLKLLWWPWSTLMPAHNLQVQINSSSLGQNGRHFTDDIFKCIFLNEKVGFVINISLKFVPKGQINNIPALVPIMAWCRPGDKP